MMGYSQKHKLGLKLKKKEFFFRREFTMKRSKLNFGTILNGITLYSSSTQNEYGHGHIIDLYHSPYKNGFNIQLVYNTNNSDGALGNGYKWIWDCQIGPDGDNMIYTDVNGEEHIFIKTTRNGQTIYKNTRLGGIIRLVKTNEYVLTFGEEEYKFTLVYNMLRLQQINKGSRIQYATRDSFGVLRSITNLETISENITISYNGSKIYYIEIGKGKESDEETLEEWDIQAAKIVFGYESNGDLSSIEVLANYYDNSSRIKKYKINGNKEFIDEIRNETVTLELDMYNRVIGIKKRDDQTKLTIGSKKSTLVTIGKGNVTKYGQKIYYYDDKNNINYVELESGNVEIKNYDEEGKVLETGTINKLGDTLNGEKLSGSYYYDSEPYEGQSVSSYIIGNSWVLVSSGSSMIHKNYDKNIEIGEVFTAFIAVKPRNKISGNLGYFLVNFKNGQYSEQRRIDLYSVGEEYCLGVVTLISKNINIGIETTFSYSSTADLEVCIDVYQNGTSKGYEYNQDGKLVRVRDKEDANQSYDEDLKLKFSQGKLASYNADNNIIEMIDDYGKKYTNEYGKEEELISSRVTTADETYWFEREYNSNEFLLRQVDYGDSSNVGEIICTSEYQYGYQPYQLTREKVHNIIKEYSYNSNYQDNPKSISSETHKGSDGNNETTLESISYTYNSKQELTNVGEITYEYNKNGQITKALYNDNELVQYVFDDIYQKDIIKIVSLGETIEYSYDDKRNIKQTKINGKIFDYNYDEYNRLINVTSDLRNTTYNYEGKLLSNLNEDDKQFKYQYNSNEQLVGRNIIGKNNTYLETASRNTGKTSSQLFAELSNKNENIYTTFYVPNIVGDTDYSDFLISYQGQKYLKPDVITKVTKNEYGAITPGNLNIKETRGLFYYDFSSAYEAQYSISNIITTQNDLKKISFGMMFKVNTSSKVRLLMLIEYEDISRNIAVDIENGIVTITHDLTITTIEEKITPNEWHTLFFTNDSKQRVYIDSINIWQSSGNTYRYKSFAIGEYHKNIFITGLVFSLNQAFLPRELEEIHREMKEIIDRYNGNGNDKCKETISTIIEPMNDADTLTLMDTNVSKNGVKCKITSYDIFATFTQDEDLKRKVVNGNKEIEYTELLSNQQGAIQFYAKVKNVNISNTILTLEDTNSSNKVELVIENKVLKCKGFGEERELVDLTDKVNDQWIGYGLSFGDARGSLQVGIYYQEEKVGTFSFFNQMFKGNLKLIFNKYGRSHIGFHDIGIYTEYLNDYKKRNYIIQEDYDAFGKLISRTFDGSLTTNYYYNKGFLSHIDNKFQYAYDENKNLIKITNNSNNEMVSYTYDQFNRLSKEVNTIFSSGETITIQYEYDPRGNRTKKIRNNVETIYTYDSNYKDRLNNVGNETIQYDENNPYFPIKIGNNTYKWNGNSLESITTINETIENQYDENQRRLTKKISSENKVIKFYYDLDGHLSIEDNGQGEIQYLYDSKGELLGFNYQDSLYFYEIDGQGVIKEIYQISSNTKNVVAKYYYDGFGCILRKEGDENILKINHILYKGYYYDEETELYYCESRYYSPSLGKFISPNKIGFLDSHNFNGLNLYTYCANNPIFYKQSNTSSNLASSILDVMNIINPIDNDFLKSNSIIANGAFRNGLFFGNGTIIGLYSTSSEGIKKDLIDKSWQVSNFNQFSALRATGQIGIGTDNFNVSLLGFGAYNSTSLFTGIAFDKEKNKYIVGFEATTSLFSFGGALQFELMGAQIELGVSVDALSFGLQFYIGYDNGKIYIKDGLSALFGIETYIVIDLS